MSHQDQTTQPIDRCKANKEGALSASEQFFRRPLQPRKQRPSRGLGRHPRTKPLLPAGSPLCSLPAGSLRRVAICKRRAADANINKNGDNSNHRQRDRAAGESSALSRISPNKRKNNPVPWHAWSITTPKASQYWSNGAWWTYFAAKNHHDHKCKVGSRAIAGRLDFV